MTEREEPQDREWLAGMVAAFLCGARGMTQLKPWPEVAQRLVAWMADRQLLADPEQGSELERRLRFLNVEAEHQLTRALAELRERTRERAQLQARLDAVERWLQPEVVVGWIQPRGYRERYLAEDVIRGLLAGDPIADDQTRVRADSVYRPCRYEVIPGIGEEGRCIANATDGDYCKPHADALPVLPGDETPQPEEDQP